MMDEVPIIDFSAYSLDRESPDPERFQKLIDEVHQALTTIGFMYLENVGIPVQKIKDAYSSSMTFYSLPGEEKRRYAGPKGINMHGYQGMEGESISTVQPGPVTTKFGENMMAISDFDDNSVSEDTKKQFLEFRKVLSNPDILSPQTAEPVIDVIVKAIEDDKPRLRYPTSQNVGDWLAKRYVKEDVTGTEGWF